jgi:cytochrome c biogenesis factor
VSAVTAGLTEILGAFLVLVGLGTTVAAAALVSTALAVLAAGLVILLLGVLTLYAAVTIERAAAKATPKTSEEPTR